MTSTPAPAAPPAPFDLCERPAPVRAFLPDLINRVLAARINPGRVFDLELPLGQVAEGFQAMDERRVIQGPAATLAHRAARHTAPGWYPHQRGDWNPPMNPQYNFEGQVALVTGAASGMGLAAARAFAQAGAAVVLTDLNKDAVQNAAKDLTDAGHQAIGVVCDVTDEDQAAAMVGSAVDTYGRLDMAFNNAGIQAPPSDAADESAEEFDRVNAVNLRGVWAAQKHELRQMRTQGSGAIVNCSSLGGLVGLPERAAYHASKHGVIGLTKSAAVEYAPKGIRINAICPGVIDTPMVSDMLEGQADAMAEILKQQPIGRLGQAEEVAEAVLWLCSPGAGFVVGVALPVDGGFTAH
ncbi:glucose 1-dehydrogenase [Nonomuraea insulae]|uniref:Glucose 1-dehydrogenase n=1 Tax=Nonomuraea insulae TaxID=1616787 RepID=A0ABW1CWZ5_9ACTN